MPTTSWCAHPIDRRGSARTQHPIYTTCGPPATHNRKRSRTIRLPLVRGALSTLLSLFICLSCRAGADAGAAMPRCLMAKKWKAGPAAELADDSDEEIDVVGEGRGRSPAPAATAPGPQPRDPEPTLLYNGKCPTRPSSLPHRTNTYK
ncbi:unnamed protein product [Diatraea saccharalis]|uniref:Uncharacterized protein n=1 Tax=Diatraea saccharalis TaxID=40085 RepID=A0A9N9WDY3_9NEOP|nr:unnamed protein product [Diatraea saccharalis]